MNSIERKLKTVLGVLVEDTSEVWVIWKSVVLKQVLMLADKSLVSQVDLDMVKVLKVSDEETGKLSRGDSHKLNALLDEARSGIEIYKERISLVPSLDD